MCVKKDAAHIVVYWSPCLVWLCHPLVAYAWPGIVGGRPTRVVMKILVKSRKTEEMLTTNRKPKNGTKGIFLTNIFTKIFEVISEDSFHLIIHTLSTIPSYLQNCHLKN
jgi:hypothetical protein